MRRLVRKPSFSKGVGEARGGGGGGGVIELRLWEMQYLYSADAFKYVYY